MTLHVPHDPTATVPITYAQHSNTIFEAIHDLQDLCGGIYDLDGGVDKLYAIATNLKTLARTIENGPDTTS